MIEEKLKLSGNLRVKQSLNGVLNNSVIYVDPITQEKEVIPTKEAQEIVPDSGFTGLSKVIVNPYTPIVDKKTITTNGIYNATDDNLDGYSEVDVSTNGVDINEYFDIKLVGSNQNEGSGIAKSILKIPEGLVVSKNARYIFLSCINLKEIPLLDTNNVTDMDGMFYNCTNLVKIPLLNTSKVTSMSSMFANCTNLKNIPLLDTSKVIRMGSMFYNCISLIEIPQFDTSNVTYFFNIFSGCDKLTTIPLLNFKKAINISQMFLNAKNIINLGGFQELGYSYETYQPENYGSYGLRLNTSPNLTHESLINVINNLYDIKTKGCKAQQLVLSPTNLAKLTAEEIAIATEKGWTVS